eukprot:1154400-Pelagomonas_calceolata.AAC.1
MRASKLKSILDRMSLKIQDKLGGKKLGDFMSAKTKLFKSVATPSCVTQQTQPHTEDHNSQLRVATPSTECDSGMYT